MVSQPWEPRQSGVTHNGDDFEQHYRDYRAFTHALRVVIIAIAIVLLSLALLLA